MWVPPHRRRRGGSGRGGHVGPPAARARLHPVRWHGTTFFKRPAEASQRTGQVASLRPCPARRPPRRSARRKVASGRTGPGQQGRFLLAPDPAGADPDDACGATLPVRADAAPALDRRRADAEEAGDLGLAEAGVHSPQQPLAEVDRVLLHRTAVITAIICSASRSSTAAPVGIVTRTNSDGLHTIPRLANGSGSGAHVSTATLMTCWPRRKCWAWVRPFQATDLAQRPTAHLTLGPARAQRLRCR